jgi:DNA-binding MarR family transcriptional regulator
LTTSFDAGANRLGALSLRIADLIDAAVRSPGERSPSAATALSAMATFLQSPSIDQLSRVLGLSSSATVRVVDGLVAEGAAVRTSTADGRVSEVRLTAAGRRRATEIVDARAGVLVDALASLTPEERASFDAAVDKILVGLIRGRTTSGARWMCRLCDTQVCGAEAPGRPCPVTLAAFG